MNKSHLAPCSGCARHVRVSDSSCPFCGASLSAAFRAQPAPTPPRSRLSRAALAAFGASSFAIAACSSDVATPLYGAPPVPLDGGSPDAASGDAGADASPAPMYGGPPIDAGHDAEPTDHDAGGNAVYGGPPIDAGHDADGHD